MYFNQLCVCLRTKDHSYGIFRILGAVAGAAFVHTFSICNKLSVAGWCNFRFKEPYSVHHFQIFK